MSIANFVAEESITCVMHDSHDKLVDPSPVNMWLSQFDCEF